MFELADSWTWDFWIVDTGDEYHLFFLFASRALHEEHRRHRRASIGHAVSKDLRSWHRVADALVRSDAPAIDDVATWTGSTVRDDDGVWRMFYTGCSDDPVDSAQRVAVATSTDLYTWKKATGAVATADPRWYATGANSTDEQFRDPWVFRGDDGTWHMLITARARQGSMTDSGVIGHATSAGLDTWQVQPPLSEPGVGFGQLEVPQLITVDGDHYLIFSCLRGELSTERQQTAGAGGVWAARAQSPLGPFDIADARLLTDNSRYAGRALQDRSGQWIFLAFENVVDGEFIGRLADPELLLPLLERAFA